MSDNKFEIVKKDQQRPEAIRQGVILIPKVDIYENDDEIMLQADLPGVTKEGLEIHIENNTLVLNGRRRLAPLGVVKHEEFESVEYQRVFNLPQGLDTDRVDAEFKNGVLTLHFPKSEKLNPRKIEVKAA